jgi:putative ABC transport system permease protein
LIKLYPARFREEYAEPLGRQFADEYREAARGGNRALFWIRVLGDLLVSIPTEIARELARDLAFALRVYRKRLPVTALAIAALALGIGATTGVFSVLNAVLLRSLPFSSPERLVEIENSALNAIAGRTRFNDWQAKSGYLAGAATFSSTDMNLAVGADSARITVAETSAGFFDLLGVHPVFGRTFAPEEDAKGREAVAVIGYGLWQQMFGGRPGVLGEKIIVNGTPATLIGVAPPGLDYPGKVAVWLPSVFDLERFPKSGVIRWRTLGRLKAGMTLDRARAMFLAEVARREQPQTGRKVPRGFVRMAPALVSIRDQLAGPVREPSLVLLGITVFVLLIDCANVAHLLLSRFAERRQELAIRMALGASRARLVQQATAESLLLTGLACAGGIAIARWAAQLAAAVQPAALAAQDYAALDWRVLLFALSLAGATGIVFGALPALALGSVHSLAGPMRAQAGGGGKGANHVRNALIATQAALALSLLAGSSIMGQAFLRLLGTDLGIARIMWLR